MHVHCCLSLSLLWEPSTTAVSTLWEYYSKNLVRAKPGNQTVVVAFCELTPRSVAPLQNASFTVPWLGVAGLGSLCKTPLALLEQARSCCSPAALRSPGHTQLYRSANSFHIFLRVLALCLGQDKAGGAPQRQIKGR